MSNLTAKPTSYSQFACIGSGFSAIALGATLQRWYGITDIRFFESHSDLGGTWFANKYPGCACDVPSLLYSFSFAANPHWTKVLPSHQELWEYLNDVAKRYGLREKMMFNTTVTKCEWIEETHRWRISVHDDDSGTDSTHECQFLYSGSGILTKPRDPEIPGIEEFKGPVFHSSQWRHDVDLKNKKVVVVGNGCTASQIVPAIQDKTAHLTQFVRSKHWVVPAVQVPNTKVFQWLFLHFPGFLKFIRFILFLILENDMRGFYMTKAAAAFRKRVAARAERYMRRKAPEEYHDMLIPEFEIGCKRRIFDSEYLEGLHAENVTLRNDAITEVTAEGVRSKDGFTEADVIVLANGFETNTFCSNIEIVGRDGISMEEHWDARGGPGAYYSTCLSGFPNFFFLLGPNTATGHTSTILAIENFINYSLRLIKPILDGNATAIDVKSEAETRYVEQIQRDLQRTVWFSGCSNWYNRNRGGKVRNAMAYPYSQPYLWYTCLFPIHKDFIYDSVQGKSEWKRALMKTLKVGIYAGLVVSGGLVVFSHTRYGAKLERFVPKDQLRVVLNSLPFRK